MTAHQVDFTLLHFYGISTIDYCREYLVEITRNVNGTDQTLVRARLNLHLSVPRETRPHYEVDISKLTMPDNIQTRLHLN